MEALAITHYSLVCAIGGSAGDILDALLQEKTGLVPCDMPGVDLATFVGPVPSIEAVTLPDALADFDCRNNRLAEMALLADDFAGHVEAARARFGPERIAVVLGTSTSGVDQCERAYADRPGADTPLPDWFHYRQTQDYYSLTDYVRRRLALSGPAQVISTACSSANKSFAAAQRLIACGLCDAAVVGGVDSLAKMTLLGFNSLELLSAAPCRPNDAARDGISIGEAGGFALLERAAPEHDGVPRLAGCGESVDAHHMAAPHPEGEGAATSMTMALANAGLAPEAIDFINLHGTGTVQNDLSEDRAVFRLFADRPWCSSTKGWTGHALGAAGIVEAVISLLALKHGFMPGNLNLEAPDVALKSRILTANRNQAPRRILSNAFGFGGNNCSLVLEAAR